MMSPQVKDGRRSSGALSFLPLTEAFCCMCTYTGTPVVISHFFLLNPGWIWNANACFAIKPINVTCCNQSTGDEAARLPVELCFHEVTRAFSLLTCLDFYFFPPHTLHFDVISLSGRPFHVAGTLFAALKRPHVFYERGHELSEAHHLIRK